jgi:tRNA modification GTPase
MQTLSDPIIAVSTAPGRAAIGIVRLSGKNLERFAQILLGKKLIARQAQFIALKDSSQDLIDEVLALYFQAPQSYTGEDVLELQGHGGQQVLQ